jgi:hypothetical protein
VREVAGSNPVVPTISLHTFKPVSQPLEMNTDYARLFKLLDGYAKRHNKCFLTELFLNEDDTEYVMCFRPLTVSEDLQGPSACRYLRIEIAEAREMTRTGLLPVSVANILDEQLRPLGLGQ